MPFPSLPSPSLPPIDESNDVPKNTDFSPCKNNSRGGFLGDGHRVTLSTTINWSGTSFVFVSWL